MIGNGHRKERGMGVKQQRLLPQSFSSPCGKYATGGKSAAFLSTY
jgi:hypothetical protein